MSKYFREGGEKAVRKGRGDLNDVEGAIIAHEGEADPDVGEEAAHQEVEVAGSDGHKEQPKKNKPVANIIFQRRPIQLDICPQRRTK